MEFTLCDVRREAAAIALGFHPYEYCMDDSTSLSANPGI
jgi:hypothetical protein